MPSSGSRGAAPWIIGGGLGALVIVLVCCVLGAVLVVPAINDVGEQRRGKDPAAVRAAAATSALVEAAENLAFSPGVRYRGRFTSASGDPVTVDARVTGPGSTLASLTVGGRKAELLATGDQTFLKAGREYWASRVSPTALAEYSQQWVKTRPDVFGVDLSSALVPGLLADELAPFLTEPAERSGPLPQVTPGPVTRIKGVDTQAITVADLTAYVTRASPHRIVRVSASRADGDPGFIPSSYGSLPALAPLGGAGVDLDLAELPLGEVENFYRAFEQRVRQLRSSVDSEVRFSLSGAITLAPCHTSGCRANITLTNRVSSGSKYLTVNRPVHAAITVNVTLDGRPVKTCATVVTMKPNGRGSTSCWASFYIAPSRNPRQHQVYARYSAVARGMVDADVQALLDDVRGERARVLPKTKVTTPSASPPAPDAGGKRREPPCDDPPDGSGAKGPGQWRIVNRGDYDALWKRYQEQISGVKRGKEYRHNDVEYDGYRNVDGQHIFEEAKSRGYSWLLAGATLNKSGKLQITSARAQKKLDKMYNQLDRQLREVSKVDGARLRYVMAEKDALDKIRAYAKQLLSPADFARIDWEHVDNDFDFKGCK